MKLRYIAYLFLLSILNFAGNFAMEEREDGSKTPSFNQRNDNEENANQLVRVAAVEEEERDSVLLDMINMFLAYEHSEELLEELLEDLVVFALWRADYIESDEALAVVDFDELMTKLGLIDEKLLGKIKKIFNKETLNNVMKYFKGEKELVAAILESVETKGIQSSKLKKMIKLLKVKAKKAQEKAMIEQSERARQIQQSENTQSTGRSENAIQVRQSEQVGTTTSADHSGRLRRSGLVQVHHGQFQQRNIAQSSLLSLENGAKFFVAFIIFAYMGQRFANICPTIGDCIENVSNLGLWPVGIWHLIFAGAVYLLILQRHNIADKLSKANFAAKLAYVGAKGYATVHDRFGTDLAYIGARGYTGIYESSRNAANSLSNINSSLSNTPRSNAPRSEENQKDSEDITFNNFLSKLDRDQRTVINDQLRQRNIDLSDCSEKQKVMLLFEVINNLLGNKLMLSEEQRQFLELLITKYE